jgi:hypothetical protein
VKEHPVLLRQDESESDDDDNGMMNNKLRNNTKMTLSEDLPSRNARPKKRRRR